MKLKLSFKVHFYSCFRYYLVYFAIIALTLIPKFLIPVDDAIYLLCVLISAIVFSIILGVYEYLIVLHTYLNFQPNPRAFWIQSIFANIINSIISFVFLLIINLILTIVDQERFHIAEFSLTFITFMFAYSLGQVAYIYLQRVKYLSLIGIVALIFIIIFFGSTVQNGLLMITNYFLTQKVLYLIPLFLTILFEFLTLIRLNRFIK